jgi:hypothetical protein
VPLDNPTRDYPEGDEVAVATTWALPPLFQGVDNNSLVEVFAELRRTVYGPTKQAKHTPWAGRVLVEKAGRTSQEATQIVKHWLDSGVLIRESFYNDATKHQAQKVVLDQAKADQILAGIGTLNAPAE